MFGWQPKEKKKGKFTGGPWHELMRKELAMRRNKCKFVGMDNIYELPFDPYKKYKGDFEKFMEEVPFKPRSQCKVPNISSTKDASQRIYSRALTASMCKNVGGEWSPTATNRSNTYDFGVCWTNPEDAHCGTQYEVPGALRKELSALVSPTYRERKQRCNSDAHCQWMPSAMDCYSKKTAREQDVTLAGKVSNPPPNMPKQITTASDGEVEPFLYEWYTHKRPSIPPATGPLFGTGNRCIDAAAAANVQLPNLRTFDPVNADPKQLEALSRILGKNEFDDYIRLKKEADEKGLQLPGDYLDYLSEHLNDSVQKKFALSLPQSVINMVMKTLAAADGVTSARGMLAWHSTGSGKTCTATAVMESFWDTNRQIIFASSLDAIASNPDYKFHECAMRFFPRFQSDAFLGNGKHSTETIMSRIGDAFRERGVRFLSFAKLANRIQKTEAHKKAQRGGRGRGRRRGNQKVDGKQRFKEQRAAATMEKLKHHKAKKHAEYKTQQKEKQSKPASKISKDDFVDLDNAILIIDEVHNLFRPLATQRQQHEYLEKQLVDPRKHPNLKVVILTATPGDNVPDVMKLLNIIRDVKKNPEPIQPPNPNDNNDIARFRNDIRGMVSFFDMSSDNTKFPVVHDTEPVKYPMSMKQFSKYLEAYKEDSKKVTATNYEQLAKLNQLNKFWKSSRKYSNMLYNFEKDMMIHEFSSKLPALLERIKAAPSEKHYVYSAFFENRNNGYGSHGILAIAKFLETELGYKKLTVAEAKRLNALGKMPESGQKRYILAVQKEIGEEGSSSAGKNLHEMIKIFNSTPNKKGDYVNVFLASQGFNEGIDLKAVRHIHIFEPLVTMASDKQTLGRAARYCSHADLDRDAGEWTVTIHRYMSDLPIDLTRPNIPVMQHNIGALEQELSGLEQHLANMSKDDKEAIKRIKSDITSRKTALKQAEKSIKQAVKQDMKNIQNIDAFIYNESRERMLSLFTVYHAMKESAVDCRLLAAFHGAHSQVSSIQCAF